MKKYLSAAAFVLLWAILVTGTAGASDLSYTYVEAGYIDMDFDDVDGLDLDGDGWGIKGSWGVTDLVHVYGAYATVDLDVGGINIDADYDTWEIGAGLNYGLAENLDVVGTLAYVGAEVDTDIGNVDDDGFGVYIGLRGRLATQFQLEGGVSYVDLDDAGDDTTLSVGGRWYFIENLALGVGYSTGDDISAWTVSGRWEMPKR